MISLVCGGDPQTNLVVSVRYNRNYEVFGTVTAHLCAGRSILDAK